MLTVAQVGVTRVMIGTVTVVTTDVVVDVMMRQIMVLVQWERNCSACIEVIRSAKQNTATATTTSSSSSSPNAAVPWADTACSWDPTVTLPMIVAVVSRLILFVFVFVFIFTHGTAGTSFPVSSWGIRWCHVTEPSTSATALRCCTKRCIVKHHVAATPRTDWSIR